MQEYLDFVVDEWPLFVALVVVVVMLGRSFLTGAKSVGPMEAVAMMNHQDAVLVDVRTDKEYAEGHVAQALHIPLGVLSDRVAELRDHKDKPIILACRSGARSASAVSILSKAGFETVYNLGGGILAWGNANLPLSTGRTKDKRAKKQAKAAPVEADKTSS